MVRRSSLHFSPSINCTSTRGPLTLVRNTTSESLDPPSTPLLSAPPPVRNTTKYPSPAAVLCSLIALQRKVTVAVWPDALAAEVGGGLRATSIGGDGYDQQGREGRRRG